jgi:hypothetical protein
VGKAPGTQTETLLDSRKGPGESALEMEELALASETGVMVGLGVVE